MRKLQIVVMVGCGAFLNSCSSSIDLFNDGMQQEVSAHHVEKVKFYVDDSGAVVKRSLYVKRQAIPDWVIAFADEKIGSGKNEYYELEWYGDSPNTRVYEVTRTVAGKKVEVSVSENRELRYIEKEISSQAVPAPVKSAVAAISGFRVTEYEEKKGPGVDEVQVEGLLNGNEVSFVYNPAGQLLREQMSLPAELEVTR